MSSATHPSRTRPQTVGPTEQRMASMTLLRRVGVREPTVTSTHIYWSRKAPSTLLPNLNSTLGRCGSHPDRHRSGGRITGYDGSLHSPAGGAFTTNGVLHPEVARLLRSENGV